MTETTKKLEFKTPEDVQAYAQAHTAAVLEGLLEKAETYDVGMQYSTPHARFVNGLEKAVPIEAINQALAAQRNGGKSDG